MYPGNQAQGNVVKLPTPVIIPYFQGGVLISKLVDEDAEGQAKKLADLPTSQLRRFYEHVTTLRRRDEVEEGNGVTEAERFLHIEPELRLLKAKAIYAYGRNKSQAKSREAYRELAQFFISHAASVKTIRDFQAFCRHFQAVVAFHKFFGKDKE